MPRKGCGTSLLPSSLLPLHLHSLQLPQASESGMAEADALSFAAPVSLFISYLISIAFFGLFQAIFMANAGGAWDNAKKVIEVDMQEKGTPLHDAAVVGDTVGDPYKDTSSVALNPIIKFTTLVWVAGNGNCPCRTIQGYRTMDRCRLPDHCAVLCLSFLL